jgi:hypothetical protein
MSLYLKNRGMRQRFFRARERKAKKSARARRKTSSTKSESAERERKKREFALFPSFAAPHWKPGS